MKEKKAILLPETLKIVIAVICIGLLIYLAVNLAGIFVYKSRIEQAKSTLDEILIQINSLEEGKTTNFLALAPKKWYIVFYDPEIMKINNKKKIPSSCKGEKCLCVCPSEQPLEALVQQGKRVLDYFYNDEGSFAGFRQCENLGVCKSSKEEIGFEILKPYLSGVVLQADYVNWISLQEAPVSISLSKENKKIIIRSISPPKEGGFLDELLKKNINFKNEDLSFEQFLIKYLALECKEKIYGGKMDSNAQREAAKKIREYIDNLISTNKIKRGEINIFTFVPNIEHASLLDNTARKIYRLPSPKIERKQLCTGESTAYIESEVTYE